MMLRTETGDSGVTEESRTVILYVLYVRVHQFATGSISLDEMWSLLDDFRQAIIFSEGANDG